MASPTPKLLLVLLVTLLSTPALAQKSSPSSQSTGLMCCTDASGRRACGNPLPSQCAGRAYKIYNQQGMVVREVGPPLTAEEKAAKAEAELQEKAAEAAAKEQKRKDIALQETYTSVQDIDRMQVRAEADAKTAIANAELKIVEARKRRKKFESEAEFYQNRALPPAISKGLRDEDVEIKSQTELIDAKKRDLEQIRAKYDEDRRRYTELTRRSGPSR